MTITATPPAVSRPQAIQPSPVPRTPWWVWVVLTLVVVGVGCGIWYLIHASKQSAATETEKRRGLHDLPVVVATARRGDLAVYLNGLGTVTPFNTVTVRSRVDGAIMKVYFTEGDFVKAGDQLVDLDDRPYVAALNQAKGQRDKDAAVLKNAGAQVDRDQKAIATDAIARQTLDTDVASMDQAKGAVEIDDAVIANATVNVEYCHITAPVTGRIGLRLVDEGNLVHGSDTTGLAVITQLRPIAVVTPLPEDDLLQLLKHRPDEKLPVEVFDRNLTTELATGTLLAIDNVIDSNTGTVKVKAQFDNTDLRLFPNQFVNTRVLVDTIKDALVVPSAAVQPSPTAPYVYVVVPDPNPAPPPAEGDKHGGHNEGPPMIVKLRNVTTGATQNALRPGEEDLTAITSGLEPGDVVVIDGVDKLADGAKVIPRQGDARKGTTQPTTGPTSRPSGGQHRRRPQ